MPLPDPGLTETGNGFMEPKYRKRFVSVMKDTPIMHWRSVSQDPWKNGSCYELIRWTVQAIYCLEVRSDT